MLTRFAYLSDDSNLEHRILHVDSALFHVSPRVDQLMNEVEVLYTNLVKPGDQKQEIRHLRTMLLQKRQPKVVNIRLRIYIGEMIVLICKIIDYFKFIII